MGQLVERAAKNHPKNGEALQALCKSQESELEERHHKILRMSEMVFVLQEEKARSYSATETMEKELKHFKRLSADLMAEKRVLNANILGMENLDTVPKEHFRINQLQNKIEEMKKMENGYKRQVQEMQIALKEKDQQKGVLSGLFGLSDDGPGKAALSSYRGIVSISILLMFCR